MPHADSRRQRRGDHRSYLVAALLAMLTVPGCWVGKPKYLDTGPTISFDAVPVVYGYNRKHQTTFEISDQDAAKLEAIFTPPAEIAWDERQQIRRAVALMEQIAGEQTPTIVDQGGPLVYAPYGSMDCVDESTNTTEYLRLFDQQGWIRHHKLLHTIMRAPFFNVHNTAQIMERETGRRFAVDSWHLDNGEMPYVQDVQDWMNSRDWPVEENPELAEEDELEEESTASACRFNSYDWLLIMIGGHVSRIGADHGWTSRMGPNLGARQSFGTYTSHLDSDDCRVWCIRARRE